MSTLTRRASFVASRLAARPAANAQIAHRSSGHAVRSMATNIPRPDWDKSLAELDPEVYKLILVSSSRQSDARL